jgi:hypothetical protein
MKGNTYVTGDRQAIITGYVLSVTISRDFFDQLGISLAANAATATLRFPRLNDRVVHPGCLASGGYRSGKYTLHKQN